ncbi:prepilin-type N-terminal cleavage/methylation domain-containing protein [Candidatus Falkowbacteria bacterium]|nr:prepilin-type N-terminal cleavage/methylation domain-containing protein [Candidatus Falkowbacteria bacterium]
MKFIFNSKDFNKSGFTLVEVLVAMGIFAVVSVIISSISLNVNNLQQNTANYQRLQNDGRYIIEKLAREIRGREVRYPVGATSTDQLNFKKDEDGKSLSISLATGNLIYRVYDEETGQAKEDSLNAEDVNVVAVKFFVAPYVEDIWGSESITNVQPRVTILLKLRNVAANPKYEKELILQTTVSSKVYKR